MQLTANVISSKQYKIFVEKKRGGRSMLEGLGVDLAGA